MRYVCSVCLKILTRQELKYIFSKQTFYLNRLQVDSSHTLYRIHTAK